MRWQLNLFHSLHLPIDSSHLLSDSFYHRIFLSAYRPRRSKMPNILPNSALAATNHGRAVQVYYQGYNGRLRESSTTDGSSYGNAHDITPSGTPVQTFTPLAATSYDNGNEVRPSPPLLVLSRR